MLELPPEPASVLGVAPPLEHPSAKIAIDTKQRFARIRERCHANAWRPRDLDCA